MGTPNSLRFFSCFHVHLLQLYKKYSVGRFSAVGIATRYGLDGPGMESRWWRGFSHSSRPAMWPTQPPIQWVPGHSRE
jgi:hypothetical protein